MKKISSLLLALIAITTFAHDVEIGGIYYNLIPKAKEAVVTYKGSDCFEYSGEYSGSVTIPSSITVDNVEYSVTSIESDAFFCTNLTSITIPNSITTIGSDAFFGCADLTSVHISDIASWCTIIFADPFANPLYYAHDIYLNGELVTLLTIPNSVTSIGNNTFYNCSNLTSITIPNSVTSIGNSAFYGCSSLTSINIPNSTTTIGSGAFSSCTNLTSVSIPNSITTIKESVFYGCSNLTSITIPNSVTSIGNSAFSACSSLTSINIPNSVTSIGNNAFYNCSSLTSIIIGAIVDYIYSKAFADCVNLETVTCLAENVPRTYTGVFENSYINYATLIVPAISLQTYKSTYPWSEFGTYKTVEDATPEAKQCAVPSIAYEDGKLYFVTATPDAQVVSEVKSDDIKISYVNEVPLTATYNITAYATKPGYDDSKIATATLHWIDSTFENGEVTQILAQKRAVLVTTNDGFITISGLNDGERIVLYSDNGCLLHTTHAAGTNVTLTAKPGDIVIIKIANETIRTFVK